jgi:hypothetical protein
MTGASGPCCTDVAVHSHDGGKTLRKAGRPYAYRCAFEWRRPVVKLVTAADRQPLRLVLNRYPGVVIGASLYFRHRGLALLWGRPGRIIETAAP